MKILQPQKYDFLYKVEHWTIPYFTLSFVNVWRRHDFLYTQHLGAWRAFLSKHDRILLGKATFTLFDKRLAPFLKKANKLQAEAKRFLEKLQSTTVRSVSNVQLSTTLIEIAAVCRPLWSHYFWTEYFCYDSVDQFLATAKGKKKDRMLSSVEQMGKAKLRMRKTFNDLAFATGGYGELLEEIQQRFSVNNIEHWTYEELVRLLRGRQPRIPDRSTYFMGRITQWKMVTGDRAAKLFRPLHQQLLHRDILKLHGQVASKGFYQGRVKVIPFDIDADYPTLIRSMRKGDVLVTGSTGPEMILACKKAGAIVTEEGGITSHASIVSRELGIPCIIGTKIATEVLKDGDLVEVDAEKGIVKKLG